MPSPRVLFGDVNPSGKLPLTFPVDEAHTPVATPEQYPGVDGTVHYREGVFVGYRGYDELGIEPRFPFGHGHSYTEFAYADLDVRPLPQPRGMAPMDPSSSRSTSRTSDRPGTEVAQVYVGPLPADVASPPRRLAGWARANLAVRGTATCHGRHRSAQPRLVGRAHGRLGALARHPHHRGRCLIARYPAARPGDGPGITNEGAAHAAPSSMWRLAT